MNSNQNANPNWADLTDESEEEYQPSPQLSKIFLKRRPIIT